MFASQLTDYFSKSIGQKNNSFHSALHISCVDILISPVTANLRSNSIENPRPSSTIFPPIFYS
jgi:hypothetical protein